MTFKKTTAAVFASAAFMLMAVPAFAQSTTPGASSPSTPSVRSTVKPFSMNNFSARGVSVTVTYQLELPSDSKEVADQISAVDKRRRVFYGAVKRECEILLELLASDCKVSTLRVSNNRRTLRGSKAMYISGTATFKVKMK